MFIVIVCSQICDVINFEMYLKFLIKLFFCMIKNVVTKPTFLEGESPTLILKCVFDLAGFSSGFIILGCFTQWSDDG